MVLVKEWIENSELSGIGNYNKKVICAILDNWVSASMTVPTSY